MLAAYSAGAMRRNMVWIEKTGTLQFGDSLAAMALYLRSVGKLESGSRGAYADVADSLDCRGISRRHT